MEWGRSIVLKVRPETATLQQEDKIMRKLRGLVILALVVAVLTAVGVFAAGNGAGRGSWGSHHGYVDADSDGVCDNQGAYCQFADANGDGVCDNQGAYCQFADADGDGVCDNRGTYCRHMDADGDGLCDSCGQACAAGTGVYYGGGRQHHGAGHGCGR